MAKHVVAYCLRNMELAATTATNSTDVPEPEYPEALQRLVGHDAMQPSSTDGDLDAAPDDDYVIGGTGLVKALTCCLKNRGDESRRQSGEFIRDVENGITSQPRAAGLPSGKAKETSKHLLSTARKIRYRLQPAIAKARTVAGGETHAYREYSLHWVNGEQGADVSADRLIFLDNTLKGIIKRFEDEFPDTREVDSAVAFSSDEVHDEKQLGTSLSSGEGDADMRMHDTSAISDGEDDLEIDGDGDDVVKLRPPLLVRTASSVSLTSKALADEEGRVLRAGHRFRAGIVKPEHLALLSDGVELVGRDPKHVRMLQDLLDELGDDELRAEVGQKGVIRVFNERKAEIRQRMREADPVHWDRFVESQEMARKNVALDLDRSEGGDAQEGAITA